jgi:hypothetical protein
MYYGSVIKSPTTIVISASFNTYNYRRDGTYSLLYVIYLPIFISYNDLFAHSLLTFIIVFKKAPS